MEEQNENNVVLITISLLKKPYYPLLRRLGERLNLVLLNQIQGQFFIIQCYTNDKDLFGKHQKGFHFYFSTTFKQEKKTGVT
jgi:hypothetical protein